MDRGGRGVKREEGKTVKSVSQRRAAEKSECGADSWMRRAATAHGGDGDAGRRARERGATVGRLTEEAEGKLRGSDCQKRSPVC